MRIQTTEKSRHNIKNTKINFKPITKKYREFKQLRQADTFSKHFSKFFTSIVAENKKDLNSAYNIRHSVFCEELELFSKNKDGIEKDCYDEYAQQCLIRHKTSTQDAGTVRIIMPQTHEDILPIEKIATNHITKDQYLPHNFARHEVCEISRIAIPPEFRRRKMDQYDGAAQAKINTRTYSETELRCFPLIAIGLYMTTAAAAMEAGRKHAYFMVEPRFARSMRFVGIKLKRIGDEFEYVGQRAPYYIGCDDFMNNLKPSLHFMMNELHKQITAER
jgi:N-acyl amino acid synthase of PEP-CTERM/exosortase system